MKYLIDTGNADEVLKWKDFVCGVTVNPLLLPKDKVETFINAVKNETLLKFVQVYKEYAYPSSLDFLLKNKIIIKIPVMLHSVPYIFRAIKKHGLKICGTLVYDIVQLHQVFDIGCDYCIVLCAKNENQNFLEEAVKLRNLYNYETKLIAASFRTKNDVKKALLSGVDYATIPTKILETMFFNAQADKDYKEIYA